MTCKKYWLLSGILGFCLNVNSASGQIVPDETTNTSVINTCQSTCNINGGTVAGENLFHSFAEFNVGVGESVYFADPGVTNIFNRVTGSNSSNLNGTLGVLGGDANLWLLNPNGIIFGAGAALDINGSFVAATADEILFGNSDSFSAIPNPQENLALLTVDPSALFFNQMGQNGSIIAQEANLSVPPESNITFIGQQADNGRGIWLEASSLNAPQGNISLGVIKDDGKIAIEPNFELGFSEQSAKGNISLTKTSRLDGSGTNKSSIYLKGGLVELAEESEVIIDNFGDSDDGEIDLEVNNLIIQDNSRIFSSNTGEGNSADINIKAKSIAVIGKDSSIFQQYLIQNVQLEDNSRVFSSVIETWTFGKGDAGDIDIEAKSLFVDRGGRIASSTFDSGATGDLNIDVSNMLRIRGSGFITASTTSAPGLVGEININTNELIVEQGGVVSSSTLSNGDAGNLKIVAADSLEIKDTPANSFVPTGIYTNTVWGNGKGGNLSIDTPKVIVRGGSYISASSGGVVNNNGAINSIPFGGKGGNIVIDAESVNIQGASADGRFSSSILSDTTTNNSAGDVIVNTEKLSISDRGEISVNSIGIGSAGTLEINADSLTLANQARLNGTTLSGRGGNINLAIDNIIELSDRSAIDTNAEGAGNGGNINIDTTFVVAKDASNITANALFDGRGGNINITAKDLFIAQDSQISASSQLGIDGAVRIETFNTNNRNNLVKLPHKTIQADSLIVKSCGVNNRQKNVFSYTGKGGVPSNLLTEYNLGDRALIPDFSLATEIDSTVETSNFQSILPAKANVEAATWKINPQGKVELVARANNLPPVLNSDCPF